MSPSCGSSHTNNYLIVTLIFRCILFMQIIAVIYAWNFLTLVYAILQTEAPLTVSGLLNSLGLEKYGVLFQAEEVIFHCLSFQSVNMLFG
jgi:hypothetical protein